MINSQTPEEVAEGLRNAMRQAIRDGIISRSNKTLKDVITDWWDDIFTSGTTIDDLCDRISDWLPQEQSCEGTQNSHVECAVEGFNDCLKQIQSNLK